MTRVGIRYELGELGTLPLPKNGVVVGQSESHLLDAPHAGERFMSSTSRAGCLSR